MLMLLLLLHGGIEVWIGQGYSLERCLSVETILVKFIVCSRPSSRRTGPNAHKIVHTGSHRRPGRLLAADLAIVMLDDRA